MKSTADGAGLVDASDMDEVQISFLRKQKTRASHTHSGLRKEQGDKG